MTSPQKEQAGEETRVGYMSIALFKKEIDNAVKFYSERRDLENAILYYGLANQLEIYLLK